MRLRLETAWTVLSIAIAAGCGGNSDGDSNGIEAKPPEQILESTANALRRVKSFHLDSANRRSLVIQADAALPHDLRLELKKRGASASLLVVQGSFYMKGNAAWWREADAGKLANQLEGRWLKVPFALAKDLVKVTDPKILSRCLVKDHGTLTRGPAVTVAGQRAIVLIDKGDRPGSAPGKLYVAATGDPLPLRLITTGRQRPGGHKDPDCGDDTPSQAGDRVDFSRYNEPLHLSAPPAAVALDGEVSN